HTITSTDTAAGSVVNVATATDTQGNNQSSSTSDRKSVVKAKMAITKSQTSLDDSNTDGLTGDAGDVISYKVTVTNTGNVILTGLTVTDPVAGGTLTSGATLAIGASDTFTPSHTITSTDTAAGSVVNVATATDTQGNNQSSST